MAGIHRGRTVDLAEGSPQALDASALELDVRLRLLARVEESGDQIGAEYRREPTNELASLVGLGVECQAHPEPELGVVLEQRVVPGRTSPGRVDRPRRRRQVPAVDGRAAGCIGDDHPVPEKLADQPQVGRLAAPGAGARELEQWLEHLAALHGAVGDQAPIEHRDRLEEVPARPLDVAVLGDRGHVDGLVARIGLALRRADVDAHAAARAVVGRNLDR